MSCHSWVTVCRRSKKLLLVRTPVEAISPVRQFPPQRMRERHRAIRFLLHDITRGEARQPPAAQLDLKRPSVEASPSDDSTVLDTEHTIGLTAFLLPLLRGYLLRFAFAALDEYRDYREH